VKELAPSEVFAASLTAASGVVEVADVAPELEPQATRAVPTMIVSPAAYSGVRAARACTRTSSVRPGPAWRCYLISRRENPQVNDAAAMG
jgi:hypothetical protein